MCIKPIKRNANAVGVVRAPKSHNHSMLTCTLAYSPANNTNTKGPGGVQPAENTSHENTNHTHTNHTHTHKPHKHTHTHTHAHTHTHTQAHTYTRAQTKMGYLKQPAGAGYLWLFMLAVLSFLRFLRTENRLFFFFGSSGGGVDGTCCCCCCCCVAMDATASGPSIWATCDHTKQQWKRARMCE